jgi:hypothetical protein
VRPRFVGHELIQIFATRFAEPEGKCIVRRVDVGVRNTEAALANLGVARANALQAKTSRGADADDARVRSRRLQRFPLAVEGPRQSHSQASQGRVRKIAVIPC